MKKIEFGIDCDPFCRYQEQDDYDDYYSDFDLQ